MKAFAFLITVLLVTLVGFATPAAAATTPGPTPVKVKVLPASNHVTGVYPKLCTATMSANGKWLPDAKCTPGAATAAVTQANIKTTICVSGYTGTIRAPQSETGPLKKIAMRAYGEPASTIGTTELDHKVPLELGGSNDESNLSPEPSDIPGAGFRNTKDGVEGRLHSAVCARKVTLVQAQAMIAMDWTTAEARLGLV